MATKKKGAAKGSDKKAASVKKVVPAKKAVKPVHKKATSKAPAKKIAKATEKSVAVKHPTAKKAPHPVHKPIAVKAAKTTQNGASKKAEPAKHIKKAHPKPVESKPTESYVNHPVTPPPFKQVPKKEPAAVKPAKLVMPDIKTKTVRKYEPDFTKSVLDTPMHEHTGPSQRYSDADLTEFRDLINKKLDAAKKELNYLQGLITRKDEMGGDESDNRYMTMEDGSISMEREQLSQMASRQITFIDHLEKALMRIENKTYGICRVTGKLIDKARLRAVPHATLSIEAKQTMNR